MKEYFQQTLSYQNIKFDAVVVFRYDNSGTILEIKIATKDKNIFIQNFLFYTDIQLTTPNGGVIYVDTKKIFGVSKNNKDFYLEFILF